jgi:hypothetical protein
MNAVTIDLSLVIGHLNRPLVDTWTLSGSAAIFSIIGVPESFGGIPITGVALQLTNADGTTLTLTATQSIGSWAVTFPATHFSAYGIIDGGVRVHALGTSGGSPVDITLATGNLCIKQDDPTARPGEMSAGVWYRGEDVFNKAGAPDAQGIQHYKKQVLAYDAEMGDWGVTWVGDYIIENGNFVEVTQ